MRESDQRILDSRVKLVAFSTVDRYVKLAFKKKGQLNKGEIRVRAPKLPAQAVPGIYMLFVLDKWGVPSLPNRVYLDRNFVKSNSKADSN